MFDFALEMVRGWMYGARPRMEFREGVNEFIKCAIQYQWDIKAIKIYCPCLDCKNLRRFESV